MNDMSQVIIPKSDQLNAEDFLAGPRTYTIEAVHIAAGTEQPVNIRLAGENRAWRPCKSMSRVLVSAWGPDANAYTGRSVTLYNDPKVKWGGMEVGGIRVSHMSHIERDMLLQLTATKGKRAPHVVKVLTDAPKTAGQAKQTPQQWAALHREAIDAAPRTDALDHLITQSFKAMARMQEANPDLHAELLHAYDVRRSALTTEGKPETDHGEGFNGFEGGDDD
jgi:hypothetical protein